MPPEAPPFNLFFEVLFLESYSRLGSQERRVIDKGIQFLARNPRHPSLQVHKAKNVRGKYPPGGDDVYIAYASRDLRITFEYGPEQGMIALRNCGHHASCERNI